MDIKRKDMPQIKSAHAKDFIKWLKTQHNIRTIKTYVRVGNLKPTQSDFNHMKIQQFARLIKEKGVKEIMKKPLIVSSDKKILDGHHRYMGVMYENPDEKIAVYLVATPIERLLSLAHKFPKSFSKTIFESKDPPVTRKQLKELENYLDRVWKNLDIDIEFTRHFIDRLNDSRNGKQITIEELKDLFIKAFKKHGKNINKSGNRHKDIGAVLTDLKTNVNSPFFLKWDNSKKEFDLVATTIMRKKNFRPKDREKKYTVESCDISLPSFKHIFENLS